MAGVAEQEQEQRGMTVDSEAAEQSRGVGGQHGGGSRGGGGEQCDSRWAMRDGKMLLFILLLVKEGR